MKVVMINDCAFVGETLIRYLPSHTDAVHLKRTRKFLDKTVKIAWKILRAEGDVYHCHYLLQDCWFTLKFGKRPVIGHAHGTDLREVIRNRKLGRFVRYNLKNCDKILVAQPTILDVAREFNETAGYFPIPYDPKLFYPMSVATERMVKLVFMASPQNFGVKGTDKVFYALSLVKIPLKVKAIRYGKDLERAIQLAKQLKLDVDFIDMVPHDNMNQLYWNSDVVLGSYGVGQLDTIAIEAMGSGRPVVHHVLEGFYPTCPLGEFTSPEEVSQTITKLLTDEKEAKKRVALQLRYVETTHSAPILAEKLAEIYEELVSQG